MKLYTIVLLTILAGCVRAQTKLANPVEILPNAAHTVDGQLRIDSKDVSMFGLVTMSNSLGLTLQPNGPTIGSIRFIPANVTGSSSVYVQSTNTTNPGLIMQDGNTGSNTNGISFTGSGGTPYLKLNRAVGNPTLSADDVTFRNLAGSVSFDLLYTGGSPGFAMNSGLPFNFVIPSTSNVIFTPSAGSGTLCFANVASLGCEISNALVVSMGQGLFGVGGQVDVFDGSSNQIVTLSGSNGIQDGAGSNNIILDQTGTILRLNSTGGIRAQLSNDGSGGAFYVGRAAVPNVFMNTNSLGGELDVKNSSGLTKLILNIDGAGSGQVTVLNNASTVIVQLEENGIQILNGGTVGVIGGGNVSVLGGGTYFANGNAGVTCSGTPTASFATVLGIVTHC